MRKAFSTSPQNQLRTTSINLSREILCTIISLPKVVEISKETLRSQYLRLFRGEELWRCGKKAKVVLFKKVREANANIGLFAVGADFFFKKSFLISRPQVIRYRIRGFQEYYRITVDCVFESASLTLKCNYRYIL